MNRHLLFLLAALILAAGLTTAVLLPSIVVDPCTVDDGSVIPGCLAEPFTDERKVLRVVIITGGFVLAGALLAAGRRREDS